MFKINEELKVKTSKKLRDAIHDIVITLNKDEFFDLGTISNILRHQYNIFITPNLLERYFELWSDDKSSIFEKSDKKWLKWDKDIKIVENNIISKKSGILGKSRKRLKKKEEEEIYDIVKKDGWIRLRDGRFVYQGTKFFKVDKTDIIEKSIYEKDSYEKFENPITSELIENIFITTPYETYNLINQINNAIKNGKITESHTDGSLYYFEIFNYLLNISKLKFKKNWEKYAPIKLKERFIRRDKRIKYEKEQERLSLETLITDRDKAIQYLSNIINLNEKYFLIVTKYNDKKSIFMIKYIIYGYFDISDDKYADGYYKVIIKKEKDGDDIIYFNTMKHFETCLDSGLKGEKMHVFNIIDNDNFKKLKLYFNELKRYKGWDQYIEQNIVDLLKNDF